MTLQGWLQKIPLRHSRFHLHSLSPVSQSVRFVVIPPLTRTAKQRAAENFPASGTCPGRGGRPQKAQIGFHCQQDCICTWIAKKSKTHKSPRFRTLPVQSTHNFQSPVTILCATFRGHALSSAQTTSPTTKLKQLPRVLKQRGL